MNLYNNYRDIVKSVIKVVHRRGDDSRKVSDGSVCCVKFTDIDCDEKESSQHMQSTISTITVGSGFNLVDLVIEYCIQSMTLAEESTYSIKHKLLNLQFTATLENCFYKPYIFQMPDSEKLSLAYNFKDQGVNLFKLKKTAESFYKFRRSLQYILSMNIHYHESCNSQKMLEDINLDEVINLMINVYNNTALIHLNFKNYNHAISTSTLSLDLKPNIKALYRRASAFAEIKEFEKAEIDLTCAIKLDKTNKAVIEKLTLVRERDKINRNNYQETVKKMFS